MAEIKPDGQEPTFAQWHYQRLHVLPIHKDSGLNYYPCTAFKTNGLWYLNVQYYQWAWFIPDRTNFGKNNTGIALNPERDWGQILEKQNDWVAWDKEKRHADLLDEVMESLGGRGWELVGIHQALLPEASTLLKIPLNYYLFKKPGINRA